MILDAKKYNAVNDRAKLNICLPKNSYNNNCMRKKCRENNKWLIFVSLLFMGLILSAVGGTLNLSRVFFILSLAFPDVCRRASGVEAQWEA